MDKILVKQIRKTAAKIPRKLGALEHSDMSSDRKRARREESKLRKARNIVRGVLKRVDS
jgi:hypothetical protein